MKIPKKGIDEIHPDIIEEISKAIKSIRYGYVQIIIQDARVIQIEKTEKYRFLKGVIKQNI